MPWQNPGLFLNRNAHVSRHSVQGHARETPCNQGVHRAGDYVLQGASGRHCRERMLFGDAETAAAHTGQAILTHLGYEVVSATSSLEGLATFHAVPYRFAVLITDYAMRKGIYCTYLPKTSFQLRTFMAKYLSIADQCARHRVARDRAEARTHVSGPWHGRL
jgi:hypothetical protein